MSEVRSQLKESSATITRLQTQQKSTDSLEVDIDATSIMLENETLHGDLNESLVEIEQLKAQLAEFSVAQVVPEKAKKQKTVTSNK